jgi:hypothetical protein
MSTASDKQISYIQSLIQRKHGVSATHGIPAALRSKYGLSQREAKWGMTKAEASELIDALRG